MKKILILLLTFTLFCMPHASALRGSGYPAYDGLAEIENAFGGTVDGQALTLQFDSDIEYSYLENGYLQACFFAFDQSRATYLEIYLLLPYTITSDTLLTPGAAAMDERTCISVYEITDTLVSEYFVGQYLGAGYPDGADYTIHIDDVSAADGGVSVSGRMSATLAEFSGDTITGKTIAISDAQFHFVLPYANNTSGANSQQNPGLDVAPSFTLPPDYAVI